LNPAANISLDGAEIELQWTGAALSSAWSTNNNWGDCQTPISGADIRIRDTGGNPYPQLSGATTIGQLVIDAGTSIDLGGQQLTVTGSIENNGTLTIPTNSAVLFNGSDDQQIYGSTAIATWEDVTVNNSGGNVIIGGSTTVNGDLTMVSGHLDCTAGDLTVVGDIVGGTSSGFIIIPEGRSVTQNTIGPGGKSGTVLFPVGSSATSYTPARILNAGTDDDFTVGLLNNSYRDGTTGAVLSDKELAKTWLIDEATPGNSNVTMTLQWHDQNEGPSFDRANAFIAHYTSGGFWEMHGSAAMSTTMGGGYYAVTAAGLSDFSPHTVASGDSPLPVELLSFSALRLSNAVRLNWSTATEINNDFFSVQRGVDGASFETLGLVDGQGNSDQQVDYEFLDQRPLSGNSYYRLKQTDFDGSFTYSDVILVQDGVARTPELSIFPNASNGLDFNWALQGLTPNTEVRLMLYDLQGNVIIERTQFVDDSGAYSGRGFEGVLLESGLYLLKATNVGKEMVSRLIVR
ncbi:MAG: T9SS type A sorting domain-containing protein, partial [Bacteroidota bacterium]